MPAAWERMEVMTLDQAAEIVTLVDEPELLVDEGEEPPMFPPETIAKARQVCAFHEALQDIRSATIH